MVRERLRLNILPLSLADAFQERKISWKNKKGEQIKELDPTKESERKLLMKDG